MTRARGRTRDCDITDARARLVDARQFLDAAGLLGAPGNGDVVATNAIHTAIDAARRLVIAAAKALERL